MPTESFKMGVHAAPPQELSREPRTDDEWVAFAQNAYEYCRPFKHGVERHWSEAILFVAGSQWVRWDSFTGTHAPHNLAEWIPTPVTNLLVEPYDRIRDLLTQAEWLPTGRAATDDQRDIDAAQVATRVLRAIHRKLQTGELHQQAADWLLLCGNAFAYANWDPRSAVMQRYPRFHLTQRSVQDDIAACDYCGAEHAAQFAGQTCPSCGRGTLQPAQSEADIEYRREPMRDKDGRPVYREKRLGEICEEAPNPFNIYPQPRDHWKRVMYVDEVVPMDLDEIVALFGSKAKEVTAEDVRLQQHRNFLEASRPRYFSEAYDELRSMALVHYWRHKPMDYAENERDGKFKKGKYICHANGVLLHEGNLDTVDGQLPYEHTRYRRMPGELWGISPFVDLIPLQKRINSIDSQTILNRKCMVSPQWTVPKNAGVTWISGQPGLLIQYNPMATGGAKPEKVAGIGLDRSVVEERGITLDNFQRIAGTMEVLSGDAPPGVEAGVALNYLTEQAYKRFGPMMRDWKSFLERHEARKLRIARLKYTTRRLFEIVGENEEVEAYHYRGADIGSTHDVYLESERAVLESGAAREQKLISAASNGWLGDVRDPKIRGRLLEKLGVEGFDSEYTLDAKKARRVLMQLKRGQEVQPPTPFDVHPIHFQILADYTKTAEFEDLEDDIQQAILQRAALHQRAMQQQQQQAMQAAQAAKGTSEEVSRRVADSGAMPTGRGVPTQQATAS